MSTAPADFQSSKRDRQVINDAIHDLDERLTRVENAIVEFAHELVELQERLITGPGARHAAHPRVTHKQLLALTYMADHADFHLAPIAWQENGGFGGSILPKLVEHGFVDRVAGNRYRINAAGLAFVTDRRTGGNGFTPAAQREDS